LLNFDEAVSVIDFGCMLGKLEVANLAGVATLMMKLLQVFANSYIVSIVEANHLLLRTSADFVDF
jgi:hypothetical protein